jgi:hypothetical protein
MPSRPRAERRALRAEVRAQRGDGAAARELVRLRAGVVHRRPDADRSPREPEEARLPREERMRGYRDVELVQHDRPLDLFPSDVVPVAVEVRARSERLDRFVHPARAVYIFGPEDGSIPAPVLVRARNQSASSSSPRGTA